MGFVPRHTDGGKSQPTLQDFFKDGYHWRSLSFVRDDLRSKNYRKQELAPTIGMELPNIKKSSFGFVSMGTEGGLMIELFIITGPFRGPIPRPYKARALPTTVPDPTIPDF